jgi:hypothetical protein
VFFGFPRGTASEVANLAKKLKKIHFPSKKLQQKKE